MQPNAAATAISNGNDRPLLSVPAPQRVHTTLTQTPPTPPHNNDPFVLSAESFFNKQNAAALLLSVAGPATPPQSDSCFQSRMAQPPNRAQNSTPPLPWQNIPAEYRPAYWPEPDLAPPHPNRLAHSANLPPPTSSSTPTSAPRQGQFSVPHVNEPRHQQSQSLSAFQLQQQQQQQPQLHLLNPHYVSLSDVKKPLSIQSRRPRKLRSMLRLAPEPEEDIRSRIVHPHFDPNEPVEILPPRSAPPQLSAMPFASRSQSQPGTPSWITRGRAVSGAERADQSRISPAQPPTRASSMRERGWDEGWEVHEQQERAQTLRDVDMTEEDEDEFELALFAEATSGMAPLGIVDWGTESPNQARYSRRRSSRQPVSPISPPSSRDGGRAERGSGREHHGGNDHERERGQDRDYESRHGRNASNTSLTPSVVSGMIPTRRSWETFLEPEPNFAASGPGRESEVLADELPSYGQSQLEASQKNRQEAARRAAELQRRWEESYRQRG